MGTDPLPLLSTPPNLRNVVSQLRGVRKVPGSNPTAAASFSYVYLLPLSKGVWSDTAPLPEKPMAYKVVWWLNSKKKKKKKKKKKNFFLFRGEEKEREGAEGT